MLSRTAFTAVRLAAVPRVGFFFQESRTFTRCGWRGPVDFRLKAPAYVFGCSSGGVWLVPAHRPRTHLHTMLTFNSPTTPSPHSLRALLNLPQRCPGCHGMLAISQSLIKAHSPFACAWYVSLGKGAMGILCAMQHFNPASGILSILACWACVSCSCALMKRL